MYNTKFQILIGENVKSSGSIFFFYLNNSTCLRRSIYKIKILYKIETCGRYMKLFKSFLKFSRRRDLMQYF